MNGLVDPGSSLFYHIILSVESFHILWMIDVDTVCVLCLIINNEMKMHINTKKNNRFIQQNCENLSVCSGTMRVYPFQFIIQFCKSPRKKKEKESIKIFMSTILTHFGRYRSKFCSFFSGITFESIRKNFVLNFFFF